MRAVALRRFAAPSPRRRCTGSSSTLLRGLLEQEGFRVTVAGGGLAALEQLDALHPDILLSDLRMPDLDGLGVLARARALDPELIVVLMTGFAGVQSAVEAMRQGADDYLLKPLDMAELAVVLDRALERRALRREATQLRSRLKERVRFESMVGVSPVMQELFKTIEQVAPSRPSVLITGESGTGKELVAQAIHENSPRAHGPFVKLHCAALAESILESELFGHEKGAFTGSVGRREGRFKQADGGTLFLDEFGDVPAPVQVKLLRFLQERTFERVGGNETLKVDVRVIAATHRDLVAEVEEGRFREDLYYRLNVVNLAIAPLRARPNDILPLAAHFLARFARESGKPIDGFSDDAIALITGHRWPGNVRELENAVERAVVMCEGPQITSRELPLGIGPTARGGIQIPGSTLAEIERHSIVATLEACGGRSAQAAQMLDISVRKIQYKMVEYGVAAPRPSVVPPSGRPRS